MKSYAYNDLQNARDDLVGSTNALNALLVQLDEMDKDIQRCLDSLKNHPEQKSLLNELEEKRRLLSSQLSNVRASKPDEIDVGKLSKQARKLFTDTGSTQTEEKKQCVADINESLKKIKSLQLEAQQLLDQFKELNHRLEASFPDQTKQLREQYKKQMADAKAGPTQELSQKIDSAVKEPSMQEMKSLSDENAKDKLLQITDSKILEEKFIAFKQKLGEMGLVLNETKNPITLTSLRLQNLDEIIKWASSVPQENRDPNFKNKYNKLLENRQDLDGNLSDKIGMLKHCYQSYLQRRLQIQIEQKNSEIIQAIDKTLSPSKQKEAYLAKLKEWIPHASQEEKIVMANLLFQQKDHIINRETGFNKGVRGIFKPVYSTETETMGYVQGLLSKGLDKNLFDFKENKDLGRSSAKKAFQKGSKGP